MINLERQGDYLFLDQKLALLIPSGATFEPETDETYAALKEIPFAMTEDGEAKTLDLLLYKVKSSDMANQILATTVNLRFLKFLQSDIAWYVVLLAFLFQKARILPASPDTLPIMLPNIPELEYIFLKIRFSVP